MPKTTRLTNRTVAPKPAKERPSSPAPTVVKKKKAKPAAAPGPVAGSGLHFHVHPGLDEIRGHAESQAWLHRGWTDLSIAWQELIFTSDDWRTTQVLSSTTVPSPVENGRFILPGVPPGTEIEFALRVGIEARAEGDGAEVREAGEVWLNNGGQNFRQTTH